VDFDPTRAKPYFEGPAGVVVGMLCGFAGPAVAAFALLACKLPLAVGIGVAVGGAVAAADVARRSGEQTLAAGIVAGVALLGIVFGGCLLLFQSII
jgi:hypothetical protein